MRQTRFSTGHPGAKISFDASAQLYVTSALWAKSLPVRKWRQNGRPLFCDNRAARRGTDVNMSPGGRACDGGANGDEGDSLALQVEDELLAFG